MFVRGDVTDLVARLLVCERLLPPQLASAVHSSGGCLTRRGQWSHTATTSTAFGGIQAHLQPPRVLGTGGRDSVTVARLCSTAPVHNAVLTVTVPNK